jgi:hypothetical protein
MGVTSSIPITNGSSSTTILQNLGNLNPGFSVVVEVRREAAKPFE